MNDLLAQALVHGQRKVNTTDALHGILLNVAPASGAAKLLVTNPNSAQTIAGALTISGKLTTLASATGGSGLVIPHGAAPTAPTNGDFWTTTSGAFIRINGATRTLAFLQSTTAFTAKQSFMAATTSSASIRLIPGVDPTAPVDGDMWITATGAWARVAGATIQLGAVGGGGGTPAEGDAATLNGAVDSVTNVSSTIMKRDALGASKIRRPLRIDTDATVTILDTDDVILIQPPVSTATTATLPEDPVVGDEYILKMGANVNPDYPCTVLPGVGETIDGAANFVIDAPWMTVTFVFDGVGNWLVT